MVGHVGNSYRPHNLNPNPPASRVGKNEKDIAYLPICLFAYLLICSFEGEEEEYARTVEPVSEIAL